MKKRRCAQRSIDKLCSSCGPNVNTEDIAFSRKEPNLVYMDKVYSYNEAEACPILYTLSPADLFTTEIETHRAESCNHSCGEGCGGCGGECTCSNGCGMVCNCRLPNPSTLCCGCTISANSVFTVTRSYVLVRSLTLADGTLTETDVTVNGIEVDTLTQVGNQYAATIGTDTTITNLERCNNLSLPTKNFFLITGAGPWYFNGTVVIEGTVNTNGETCCFKAKFTTPIGGITIAGPSTFAIPKLALPCVVNGVSPSINFSFGGTIYVLNPAITATATETSFVLTLTGALATQPSINTEVVRKTLFCIDACEGMLPCDGTEAAFELDEEDDCTWPPAPACCCGTSPSPMQEEDICEKTPRCNFDEDNGCDCICGEGHHQEKHHGGTQGNCGYEKQPVQGGCGGCGWQF